ncbi:MAG TPA: NAD(P)-dependent oxidoreductase [Novosphingobium sp.]|nr:NAD(P)-dependent oxidoreductase [Novosphingobium sp.]
MSVNDEANAAGPAVLCFPLPELMADLRAMGCTVIPWPRTEEEHRELLERAEDVRAVVTIGSKELPEGFLDAAPNVGLVACMGAGYENYDPAALRSRGIDLVNAAGLNADDVADLGFGLLLAAYRNIVASHASVLSGAWRPAAGAPTGVRRLRGRRLGVLGMGAIGKAMAMRGAAFGMDVRWWGPRPKDSPWQRMETPMELAEWADALAVCCRPTAENENMVNAEMLDALGPQGVVVNVARGSLIDEDELIVALKAGRVGAAGLDVFKEEPTDHRKWQDVPHVTLHPHNGGGTVDALADGRASVVESVRKHLAGEPLTELLN